MKLRSIVVVASIFVLALTALGCGGPETVSPASNEPDVLGTSQQNIRPCANSAYEFQLYEGNVCHSAGWLYNRATEYCRSFGETVGCWNYYHDGCNPNATYSWHRINFSCFAL